VNKIERQIKKQDTRMKKQFFILPILLNLGFMKQPPKQQFMFL